MKLSRLHAPVVGPDGSWNGAVTRLAQALCMNGLIAQTMVMKKDSFNPYNLDDEARAELLVYLVVGQLIARVRTEDWLLPQHLSESALLWLRSNGANCSARERAALSALSVSVAEEMRELPDNRNEKCLANLFTENWRLDYRQAAARALHDVCAEQLAKRYKPPEC